MPNVHNYDPARVHLSIVAPTVGIVLPRVEGFAIGSTIRVRRSTATYTMIRGILGQTTRTRSRQRNGMITFALEERSPHCVVLDELANLDENSGLGVAALSLFDQDGSALALATFAWQPQIADLEKAETASPRVFMFEAADVSIIGLAPVLAASIAARIAEATDD